MFHVKHEGWEAVGSLDVTLDGAAIDRLESYERLLHERAIPMGMVARADAFRIRERHLLDCLRAAPLLPSAGSVCDLGSGAGLPGLVLAIARPGLRFVLVEVRRNRATFLRDSVEALGLEHVEVFPRRLETLRGRFDVCTARAFADPRRAWEASQRSLQPAGRLIYWAGLSFDVATDVPDGVRAVLFTTPALARSGPLAIMTRQ